MKGNTNTTDLRVAEIEGEIDALKVKSATFSGTTDSTGNCNIAPLSQGVVVSIREVHNYMPIFMITSGNNNYAKFININASTFQPVANTAVSGEYFYLEM